MQIRKVPIMLSMLTTVALLFGSWFLYQKVNIEEPIRVEVGQLTSANLTELKVERDHVNVTLEVTKPELFPDEYTKLVQKIEQVAPNKKLDISMLNQDKHLKKVWSDGLFSFTEAMDLHQYSKIPVILDQMKEEHKLDQVQSSMDENHVYVFLKRGTSQFYAIVPKSKLTDENEVTARG